MDTEKFTGFIIQPFRLTPSPVLKVKNSFWGTLYLDKVCFRLSFVTSVLNTLPVLSFRVMTVGVFRFE